MRHVAYSTNAVGESPLVMAINATAAENTLFSQRKSGIRLGGGIYAGSGSRIVNIVGVSTVAGRDYGVITPAEAVHCGNGRQFRGESKTAAAATAASEADKKVIRYREADGEYYGHMRLLSAISAANVVPASRPLPSEKWPFQLKQGGGRGFFKRKRRPSLSNVDEIHEHDSVVAPGLEGEKVLLSEHRMRRSGDAEQTSKTSESCGGIARNANNEFVFPVADDFTSLISVSKLAACIDVSATINKRLLSSDSDLRETQSYGCSASVKSRSASLSKSWYEDQFDETEAYLDQFGFPKEGGHDEDKWGRRKTFRSLPEYKDGYLDEISASSEERVVLLERSASMPEDEALSTPPARKTTTISVDGNRMARNSVPSADHSTTTTSSNSKLSKRNKSSIDLLLPSLKSLVTMTANKLSASRPANLNYWRNGNCNGGNQSDSRSRFNIRAVGASSAASLRRNVSLNNVRRDDGKNASSDDITELRLLKKKLRKCNTVLALSRCVSCHVTTLTPDADVVLHVEPLKPVNRLRICPNNQNMFQRSRMCSRCSSLLSMASSSRYSLNSAYGFVPASAPSVLCKVCLNEVPLKDSWTLQHCECSYCVDCVRSYVEFEINQGAYSISCPDAQCEKQGIILLEEIESLVSLDCIRKHKRYRLNKEVEMDKSRTWCPRAGCETVCTLCSTDRCLPQSVHCPTCSIDFCSNCRVVWHPNSPCKSVEAIPGITFDSELIKCCPLCSVPIEKDEGCAQMLCKRCKHVFCWYCLASLDDDFLLRHYDKGPCKNKLGHSRASVIWHRTQVISIFAGFGVLLLIASPLLLLAAPCIVCCKCRVCTNDSRLDSDDDIPEAIELHLNAEVSSDQEAGDAH